MDPVTRTGFHCGYARVDKRCEEKWDISVEKKIHEIHRYLKDNPYQFYTGATAIAQEWKVRFPEAALPPLRTIGKIMSDLGLTARKTIVPARRGQVSSR